MEYRYMGKSGLQVPALSFGAGTFGGKGPLFSAWGNTDVEAAKKLIDICLEAGANMFDTADVYSDGESEKILGAAVKGRRDQLIISTKTTLPMGDKPGDWGSSRARLIKACEASLKRLDTDYIDLFYLHAFDGFTPVDEVLSALDALISAGKIRYIGASNFSGWELMKSLAVADRYGYPRYVANQAYYSLVGRDYEWELMPLGLDQGIGAAVWSPLGWGRLTGNVRRDQPIPPNSRLHQTAQFGPPVDDNLVYDLVEVMDDIAAETGRTIPQIAINWLLQRPTVATVVLGARNEEQLRDNLGAVGWALTQEQIKRLDQVSEQTAAYPYFAYRRQEAFAKVNPPVV
ncbi:aldo/keto reductase [Cellvibrio sp. PSBB006]|uniref:aldo/keto reductase n=1 Tax=Cellvibrio sp. PSBB006 TaxID=1987723 RepID=UPI000B3B9ECF|nr:aldo/keto reductase [Cellvibrio sp. PSBB006]ARU28507.1 aldo/keto reductase [Cellvibrio sp. PSBB006]